MKSKSRSSAEFVICARNEGYPESPEKRKLYRVVPDPKAARVGSIRVIDESGEDYLYPAVLFAPVKLPADVARTLVAA